MMYFKPDHSGVYTYHLVLCDDGVERNILKQIYMSETPENKTKIRYWNEVSLYG
jgi:hypothetical protein